MPTIPAPEEKTVTYGRVAMAADVSHTTRMSKVFGKNVVDMLLDNMAKALSRGDVIDLGDIGKLEVKVRKAREGRNPKTGEKIFLPESKSIRHFAGKTFTRRVLNAESPKDIES